MFSKLRTARWLKANVTPEGAEVGFFGRVALGARASGRWHGPRGARWTDGQVSGARYWASRQPIGKTCASIYFSISPHRSCQEAYIRPRATL